MSEDPEKPPEAGTADAKASLLRGWVARTPRWLDVDGRSMWPTIRPPARVMVAPAARPSRGEVWAFVNQAGEIVVHRCRRGGRDRVTFWGDGLARPDPPVRTSVLVGRVVEVEDPAGHRLLGRADQLRGIARQTSQRLRHAAQQGRRWARRLMVQTFQRR